MKKIAFTCCAILLIGALFLPVTRSNHASARQNGGDKLVYTLVGRHDEAISYSAVDLSDNSQAPIYAADRFHWFSLSIDGRFAFSAGYEGDGSVYILDTRNSSSTPVNISPVVLEPSSDRGAVTSIPFQWSPDGRYLVFSLPTPDYDQNRLYVWDGEQVVDITPEAVVSLHRVSYGATWSQDHRLAIRILYFNSPSSDIFVWDGKTTMPFAPKPGGQDRYPTWSTDGRLAFVRVSDGEYDILVWDGVSIKNGVPDPDTFIKVAPELTTVASYPVWTNTGLLAFKAPGQQSTDPLQIYAWDGQTTTVISPNPKRPSSTPVWNVDGRWAFASGGLIFVQGADNRTTDSLRGILPMWSPDGRYLAFCTLNKDAGIWSLSVWDGDQVTEIVRDHGEEDFIYAGWQGGDTLTCIDG